MSHTANKKVIKIPFRHDYGSKTFCVNEDFHALSPGILRQAIAYLETKICNLRRKFLHSCIGYNNFKKALLIPKVSVKSFLRISNI